MKKIIAVLLVLTLCFAFTGCSDKVEQGEEIANDTIDLAKDLIKKGGEILSDESEDALTLDDIVDKVKNSTPEDIIEEVEDWVEEDLDDTIEDLAAYYKDGKDDDGDEIDIDRTISNLKSKLKQQEYIKTLLSTLFSSTGEENEEMEETLDKISSEAESILEKAEAQGTEISGEKLDTKKFDKLVKKFEEQVEKYDD